jgi:hypothetical protein
LKAKSTKQDQIAQKLRKLCQTISDLKNGARNFSITRLTVVKSLCPDVKTSARFTAYLAQLAQERKEFESRSVRFTAPEKKRHKQLAADALTQIELYLERRSENRRDKLYELLRETREVNNVYRNIPYGVLRVVQNWRMLLIEKAIQCSLSYDTPTAAFWAYQMARDYAEKYDPSYGTGLIPESTAFLEDIVDFWCIYYFGKSAEEWCAVQPAKKSR